MKYVMFFIFTISLSAWGNNHHEHFYSLPKAENFVDEAGVVRLIKEDRIGLTELFRNPNTFNDRLHSFLQVQYNLAPKEANAIAKKLKPGNSVADMLKLLPGGIDRKNLIKLFKLNNKPISPSIGRETYLTIESIRRKVLENVDDKAFFNIFDNYFKSEKLINRSVVNLTVPSRWLHPDYNLSYKLVGLKKLGTKNGSDISFLSSALRKTTIRSKGKIQNFLFTHMETGLLDGFDITGSINEQTNLTSSKDDIFNSLKSYADETSKRGGVLRIHAFEQKNSGPFYDALKDFINTYDKSLNLEIGHINKLDDEWMDLLANNKNLNVTVDANLISNVKLQGASYQHLYARLRAAENRGLKTVIGSDGVGILPESTYESQIKSIRDFEKIKSIKKPLQTKTLNSGVHCLNSELINILN
jgi:hypothetical protein